MARYQFAQQFINPEDSVLDAPCGVGYGSFLMAQKSKKIYGVDISESAIHHAKRKFNHNWKELDIDSEELKQLFPHGALDVVISFEGIEHIQNPERFLKNCHAILSPHGRLLISTPRRPHGSPFHITEYNQKEFENLLERNGFRINKKYGQVGEDIKPMEELKNPEEYFKYNFIFDCSPR